MRNGESRDRFSELWVCFVPPRGELPADALVLSFMSAGDEGGVEGRLGSRFVSGREVAHQVHTEARRLYVDLIARIGATPCVGGKTLRQALRGRDGYSRWWLHKVSEKDCGWDDDPTYLTLIRLLCVRKVAADFGVSRVRVYGGNAEFAAALQGRGLGLLRTSGALAKALAWGFLSRLNFLRFHLSLWWVLRRVGARQTTGLDVALQAHWDWSLRPGSDGALNDLYFTDLPERLRRDGLRVGWFATCEPRSMVWQRGRRTRDVVAASVDYPQVVLLERYLGLRDILAAGLRLRYLVAYLRFAASPAFRQIFRLLDFDVFPIMRPLIVRLFAGSTIGRRELVLLATARACRDLRPRILLTFLELFLHSRAMYAGARLGSRDIQLWSAQHGAYCSDKTGAMLEPALEFKGEPDGCGVMVPDRIFAMGELAKKIWEGSGFPPERVLVTGGLRFQQMRAIRPRAGAQCKSTVSLLLICAMNEAWDLDMCAAAALAAEDIPSIRLRFRDHPAYCLSERRGFDRFRQTIQVTSGTVDEDLAAADLVLFTYSGLAEEALLQGLPVWQWRWAGVIPSVFVDLPVVSTFTTVRGLRAALRSFIRDPEKFRPTPEVQDLVLRQCFSAAPSQASARIAEEIANHVRRGRVCAAGAAGKRL